MKQWYNKRKNLILGTAGIIVFFGIWQMIASLKLTNTLFTSSPVNVATAAWTLMQTLELWKSTGYTILEFAIGFILGAVFGIIIGILMGWYKTIYAILNPFVVALYAIPRIALLPMFVLWFGIGMESRIMLTFSVAIIPVIVNTLTGMRVIDRSLLNVSRLFGANDYQVFRTLALPGSVPYIISGLRIGTGQAFIGVIAGELFIGNQGLGYLLTKYGTSFQTANLVFVILITAVLGIVTVYMLERVEKKFEGWRPSVRGI